MKIRHMPTPNSYNLEDLTLGKLIAIRTGLVLHGSTLAKEIVRQFDQECPEIKGEYETQD